MEIRVEIGWRARTTLDAVPHNPPLPSVVLAESGYLATIEPDRFVPGAYQLIVDGTPQSHVDLDDPAGCSSSTSSGWATSST